MLKKRLIFTLLYLDGNFQLSRNFQLQQVGDIGWLYDFYNLKSITNSIDELIILNVGREEKNFEKFLQDVARLSKNCFMPIAIGGGIDTAEKVSLCLKCGADKVVINSALFENKTEVDKIISRYGKQVVVASIDYSLINNKREIFIKNGLKKLEVEFEDYLEKVESIGVGELYLTSIDRDGTGQGYDYDSLFIASKIMSCPIIASGGVGNFTQLKEGLEKPFLSAVSTANIFNFLANGLTEARDTILNSGIPLARWDRNLITSLGK